MAEIFDNYPDVSEAASEYNDKATKQPAIDAKAMKCLKKLHKQLRKQNKLLRQIRRNCVEAEPPIEEQSATSKEDRPKTTGREEKSFITKLGDVFLKVLPRILTDAASGIVKAILGRVFNRGKTPMEARI